MPVTDKTGRPSGARLVAGSLVVVAGCALAVWALLRAVNEARRVGFDVSALPPDWLAGCLLLVTAGVLCALAGAGILRGRWWAATGQALVAVLAGYSGARLVFELQFWW